jgi:hypothetical protein
MLVLLLVCPGIASGIRVGSLCYARTLRGAMKCPERRESGALLFYEQWVSI